MNYKDTRGVSRTESLFIETIHPRTAEKYTPVYSLKQGGNKGYPSAYDIYMSCIDESEAALLLVGTMAHWRKLCSLKWFRAGRAGKFEGLDAWRLDMESRDETLAKTTLTEQCKAGSVPAARALMDWAKTQKKKNKNVPSTKLEEISDEDSNVTNFLSRLEKKDV